MAGISVVLIGVALTLAGVSAVEAQWPLGRDMTPPTIKSEPPPQVTTTGRFQIFVSPNIKDHTFMLDTDTGRIWIMKKNHSTGEFYLQRVTVRDVSEESEGKSDSISTKDKPSE